VPPFSDPAVPRLGSELPRAHGRIAGALGRLGMGLAGWRFEGSFPDLPRMVLIVAPHTSNWDFVVGLSAKLALRLKASFLAKHTLFWWPLGAYLRSIGGIPIDRSAPLGVVDEALRALRKSGRYILVIAPEGTRRRVGRWKSGFYRIAEAARVPIFLVAFDYGRKVVRLGPLFEPTGDYDGDLATIRSHYDGSMACRPELF
jgi:1-acyl-sn-glycerol-3-phosphate acyltransferase